MDSYQKVFKLLIDKSRNGSPFDEFQYIGGNSGEPARKYRFLFPEVAFPPKAEECLCGQLITENWYLQHNLTDEIITVCNSCVSKFQAMEGQLETRKLVSNDPLIRVSKTKSSKIKWMLPPKKSIKTNIRRKRPLSKTIKKKMNFGKYRDYSYQWVIENDPDYCEWVKSIPNPGYRLREFQTWLV